MSTRYPHVAGSFYPASSSELRNLIKSFDEPPKKAECLAKAVILPHAGYVYSGKTAWKVIAQVSVPGSVFLMGPNHWGTGFGMALDESEDWETPLGKSDIDQTLTSQILKKNSLFRQDGFSHQKEHSLEVIIPMLQIKNSKLKFVPLVVGTLDFGAAYDAASCLGERLAGLKTKPLVVVSTDMNHYESDDLTRKKDRYALDAIQALDAGGLIQAVRSHRISMCGVMPVYMLLVMADKLGIKRARLVDYRTSAEVSGDYDRVVGYAGFVLD